MENKIKNIIKEYQCTGCVDGPLESGCYEQDGRGFGCKKHRAGTFTLTFGNFYLGMPKGFCRIGSLDFIDRNINYKFQIEIFNNYLELNPEYDKFNIPCWKYFDGKVTMVRGLMPRINIPFLHIFIGDYRNNINCLEITKKDIDEMD